MELKLVEIIESKQILVKLGSQIFNAKTSFRIQKNIKEFLPIWDNFDSQKKMLFEKYGTYKKDQYDNEGYEIMPEKMDEFNKELNEMLAEKIEVNIMQIDLNELNYAISPLEMMKIDWMIDADSA